MENKYYVYQVVHEGEVIYVGKGKGGRYKHATSGKSHNYKLNEFHFKHKLLGDVLPEVDIIKYFEEEKDALAYESKLILEHYPYCNIQKKENALDLFKVEPVKDGGTEGQDYVPVYEEGGTEKEELVFLPTTVEDVDDLMKKRYEIYLENTELLRPNTYRTFLSSLLFNKSLKWRDISHLIEELVESIPDMRKDNGGHNKREFAIKYGLSEKEAKCINNRTNYLKKKGKPVTEEDLLKTLEKFRRKNGK